MELYIVAETIGTRHMVPYSGKVYKRLSYAEKELTKANEKEVDRYEILYVDSWFRLSDRIGQFE